MATTPVFMRLMASCVRVSEKAAEVVREILNSGDLGIVDKGGQKNLQTKADRKCEQVIRASLMSKYPSITLIGEEDEPLDPASDANAGLDENVAGKQCPDQYKDVKENEIVVWVDPLDGTAEFTEGLLDHVTILIGVAVGGKAVGGVINQPFFNYQDKTKEMGRTIWGVVGLGAFGWDKVEVPDNRRVLITTRSHSNKLVTSCLDNMKPTQVERQGGAGNKVLKVMEGVADAYVFPSPGCKKWDTCAPEAVLVACGGELTDMWGNKMEYHADVQVQNMRGTIATMRNHQQMVNLVPPEVLEEMKNIKLRPKK